ncbi:DUF354 domain-containing protein [Algoriphagus chordae]|uniref:DUF354 domain-containing protein n=1 Tax=Algoriphagus chordae TaxID=237019 RepID=A0A2W7R0Y1_9BACT|nr:DUF354 domain-containing protein [Algoriphagus chordae]PZX54194.1 hypothetical protein LV85_01534 [Algoriphagus chordae]
MKIFIDIGHPGHVHYFKNFYFIMINNGHDFLITARDKPIICELLETYGIPYLNRGRGKDSKFGKLLYMLQADVFLIKKFLNFKPDISISFSSPYAAQTSFLFNVPHIALNDTEHTDKVHSRFTYPFSKAIITPQSYQNNLGAKHIRFNNVVESLYLHPTKFSPNQDIYTFLGIESTQHFAIVRFVSWNAFHDVGQGGFTLVQKREIVRYLSSKMRVFISSEGTLDEEFSEFQISIPPDKMHDALSFASLFVGESGTMASESSLLGTPAIYVNSLPLMCYLKLEKENDLLYHFTDGDNVLEFLTGISDFPMFKLSCTNKLKHMVSDFVNPTDFLIWFVANYPKSFDILKADPDYQYNIS